ncbi:MAG: acetate/propionate family kinase [Oxalobacter sp.]|jgi:acetate kinase|nr:acetate/propionate family kinase [Oxalobacter sp.]
METKSEASNLRFYAVLNAGSSSLKYSLFAEMEDGRLERRTNGSIEGIGSISPSFTAFDCDQYNLDEYQWNRPTGIGTLLAFLINWIENFLSPNRLSAVGHRMLHGGTLYDAPVLVTPAVLKTMRELIPLAPLHQPRILQVIDTINERYPGLCQIVCFDTSFHKSNPPVSRLYGLPRHLTDKGLIHYGFHGLSFEYVSEELKHIDRHAAMGKTIIAHLGSGASMCAMVNGKSIATTMGFSALDGLVMGTRCGQLDPGVILYLIQHEQMKPKELETLLYQDSGLLGVSGISNDVRDLMASTDPYAKEALDLFVYRVVRETGSLAAACGGLDAFVFTAGIGERSPYIRKAICRQLDWLGVELDERANNLGELKISTVSSRVSVWILPTYEELMIARHVARLSRETDHI